MSTQGFAAPLEIGNCDSFLCSEKYQKYLLKKVAAMMPQLVDYPAFHYPNKNHAEIVKKFPKGKVLVFGYGSLMNKESAARTVKPEAVATMDKAIAFGVKRIFNYKATKTDHWGANQNKREKAMLNLSQTLNISSIANGVIMEVDAEDFSRLVKREAGYDLVPILVARWDDVANQNPDVVVEVAYTFSAVHELRNHIDYTSTEYYPVRGYLHAIQEAARGFGDEFATMWNSTTYLADGTTSINEWDEETFEGILCTIDR
jgi:cation transport regulator ChaC